MERDSLLSKIYTSRADLEAVIAEFAPEPMLQPLLPGGWSVKDTLAHIEFWENRLIQILTSLQDGQNPGSLLDGITIDELNEQVYQRNRARDLEEVRQSELNTYKQLMMIIEGYPPDDLFNPTRFAYTEGKPLVDWIEGNTYGHYAEHLEMLRPALERQQRGQEILTRARDFLRKDGRDIDIAIYDYHFGGGSRIEHLLQVLSRYQNADGGFTGLEVDIKSPVSNPFACELALIILLRAETVRAGSEAAGTSTEVGVTVRQSPVFRRLLQYLEDTQQEDGTWRFTPEVYEDQLPPWFKAWQWPNLNPSCPIAGLLKQMGAGSDRLHMRVEQLFAREAKVSDLVSSEYYNVKPYADYFQTEWQHPLAELYRSGVVWWLIRQDAEPTGMDASHFLSFAPSPQSAVAKRLPPEALNRQLDRLQAEQAEDGGWPTPYDPAWRGWLTVTNLLILRAYGRV